MTQGDDKKTLLFWGPHCAFSWLEGYVLITFEPLRDHGWDVVYFFPPLNEFRLGIPLNWRETLIGQDLDPNVHVIKNPARSYIYGNDHEKIAASLKGDFKGYDPDVVVTRTGGHDYLKILFPHAVILTMADGMGAPWFGPNAHSFTLTEDPLYFGNSFMAKFAEDIRRTDVSKKARDACLWLMNVQDRTNLYRPEIDNASSEIQAYFETLYQSFKKIYIYPSWSNVLDTQYVLYSDMFEYETNADIIHNFLAESDEDTLLLVTTMPNHGTKEADTALIDAFRHTDRVRFISEENLDMWQFTTANILPYADGMINALSKSYWHALACGKPFYSYLKNAVDFAQPAKDLPSLVNKKAEPLPEKDAVKLFYWYMTRFRFTRNDTERLARTLDNFISSCANGEEIHADFHVYDWAQSPEVYDAYLWDCTATLKAEAPLKALKKYHKIWLYGASIGGMDALREFAEAGLDVAGVADGFKDGNWQGYVVMTPAELLEAIGPDDAVFIASSFWMEIVYGLRNEGLTCPCYLLKKPGITAEILSWG